MWEVWKIERFALVAGAVVMTLSAMTRKTGGLAPLYNGRIPH